MPLSILIAAALTGCVYAEPDRKHGTPNNAGSGEAEKSSVPAREVPPDPVGYSAMTTHYLRMFNIDPTDISDTATRATEAEIERRRRELRPDWQDPDSWVREHRRTKWSDYYYGKQYPSSDLQEQIDAAIAAGKSEVTIRPGIYMVPPFEDEGIMITINGAKDLVINARDVFLIGQSPNRYLDISHCENVTLNGLVMDITAEGLPYAQGTIIARDEDGEWVDVEFHKGYPMPKRRDGRAYKFEHYDSRTLLLADDSPTMYRIPYSYQKDGVFRFHVKHKPGTLPVGDYVTFIIRINTPHAINIEECTNLTLRGIKLHAAALFAILENTCANTHYDGIEITPGPMFDGTDIPRLKSGTQDGIHIGDMRGDSAIIENSIIECHSDDGIAINSGYSIVVRTEGNTYYLTCKNEEFNISDGDEVYQTRVSDMQRMGSAHVTAMEEVSDPALLEELAAARNKVVRNNGIRGSGLRHGRFWRLELDHPVEVDGDQFFSRQSGNYGITIRNNFIANHRARSLLLKTSGALVENNVVFHGQNSPLVMSVERFWTEGDYSRDMVVRNNTFIDCGYGWMQVPANDPRTSALFTIIGESEKPGHHNLIIASNRLEFCHRMPMWISSASHVRVENNHINYVGFRELSDGSGQPHVVRLEHVDGFTYHGNTVNKVGPFFKDKQVDVRSSTNIEIK